MTAFVLLSAVVTAMPGASILFVVTRSLTLGRGAGIAAAVGNTFGVYVQVVVVALGVGALMQRYPAVFAAVKLVGALYLVFLGVQTIRHRRVRAAALDASDRQTLVRTTLNALAVGATNPKLIVFFVAVLPQFVDPAGDGSPGLQMLTLGLVFCALEATCNIAWVLAAATAHDRLVRSPRAIVMVGGAGGGVMVIAGLGLAVSVGI